MTVNECIRAIKRDRRDPDKVLANVARLERALDDVRRAGVDEGISQEVYNMLYVDRRPLTAREELEAQLRRG